MDGWVAGGPDDQHLYVTHDAAKSWHEVALKPPPEVPATHVPTYNVPAFSDSKHGSLTVTYSGPDRSASALVMFTTDDAGKTWKPDRVLLNLEETSPGMTVPSTAVGSTLIAAIKSGAKVTLTIVGPGNDVKRIDMHGFRQPPTLSFADASHGWASTANGLFSTIDGGVSWTEITPTRTRH
jgi:photosystem II stability/assembly factor-like uncharacterized protein